VPEVLRAEQFSNLKGDIIKTQIMEMQHFKLPFRKSLVLRCPRAFSYLTLGAFLLGVAAVPAYAETLTVDTVTDVVDNTDGVTSLREAITAANADPTATTIAFNIPAAQADATGVFTISPTTNLPTITTPVTIDGYTQTGAAPNTLPLAQGTNARLLIELSGTLAGFGSNGLSLVAGADNSVVRGLIINGFGSGVGSTGGVGIGIDGANGVTIAGNFLGTSAAGTSNSPIPGPPISIGGNQAGIAVVGANNTSIGGTDAASRNLISNNAITGINISNVPTSATPNRILNNLIGTDATGTIAVGNGVGTGEGGLSNSIMASPSGVFIADAAGTLIGGTDAGNVISGNNGIGIILVQSGTITLTTGTLVRGNFIGTTADGTGALGNTGDGIELVGASGNTIGGLALSDRNRIESNTGNGIALVNSSLLVGNTSDNNAIEGNIITANTMNGIMILAGTGNRISANSIFDNTQLGIDLVGGGLVNPNDAGDADTGANDLQNFPVISTVETNGTTTTVTGTLDSVAGATYYIQYFANAAADPLLNGEGQTYVGAQTINPGPFSFTITLPAGQNIVTATATNTTTNSTSEFSNAVASTVVSTNTAPVNTVPAAQTTAEDSALTFSSTNSNAISVADADAGTNALQVTLTVNNGTLTLAQNTGLAFTTGDGTSDATMTFTGTIQDINAALNGLRFDPTANFNGQSTLTITTNDQGNTGTGGALQDSDNVTINVTAVNDAPVAVNDTTTTNEDTALNIDVKANDTDVDNSALTVTAVTPGANTNGTLAINPDGSVRYEPALNFNGTSTFTYTVSDGALTANATVTVQVLAVNDAPVSADQSTSTEEDTSKAVMLTATDVDNSTLSYQVITQPQNGTLSGTVPNLTYTPNANYTGRDSFTFRANDGTADSNVATVTINVGGVNDVPVANDDAFTLSGRGPLNVAAPGVVGNDTDADGDTLRAILAVQPTHGTLQLNADGSFSYTPEVGFNGNDLFSYRATDGTANSNEARVTITVSNNAPLERTLSLTVPQSTLSENDTLTATITLSNTATQDVTVTLSSSDTLAATVPGTVTIPAGSTSATFAINGINDSLVDGTQAVTITAQAGEFGNDTINLSVTDDDVPTLTLTVAPGTFNENAGPAAAVATLTRNARLGERLTVRVVSSDGGEARVPQEVMIPSGAQSTTFYVAANDDRVVDGLQRVNFTAVATGFRAGRTTVTVQDNGRVTQNLQLQLASTSGVFEEGTRGDQKAQVFLQGAPLDQDVIITLESSDPTKVRVPKAVRLRAGQLSAAFVFRVLEDNVADGTQVVFITARATSLATSAVEVRVVDNDEPKLSITLRQSSVRENASTLIGTLVVRNTPATSGITVRLTSSAPQRVSVPNEVWLPEGRTSVEFAVTVLDNNTVDGTQNVTLTASRGGFQPGTATLQVQDDDTAARTAHASAVKLSTAGANAAVQNVVLKFTGALDDAVLNDVARYIVAVNDKVVPVESIAYDRASSTLTLGLSQGSLQAGDKVQVNWRELQDRQGLAFSGQTSVLNAK
jgi:parallel beta-helix repeat protein/VCBS repeat-containing protein